MICTDETTGEEICNTKHKNKSLKIKTFMIDEFDAPVSSDKAGTVLSVNDSGKITYLTASELLSEIESGGLDEKFQALQDNIDKVDTRVTEEVATLNQTITDNVETLNTTIEEAKTTLNTRITSEVSNLKSADETIKQSVTDLQTLHEEDINDVDTRLETLEDNLDAEVTRATTAEQANATAIATENSRATAVEKSLSETKADKTEIKDGVLTIVLNGEELGTFSANQGEDKTIEITSSAAIMRFWD